MEVVQSVDRALTILELLSNYNEGLGVTEIGNKIELHKSTVHRLLNTLIYKGFVTQDIVTNKYKTSLKLYELGSKKLEGIDILEASKGHTKKLMEKINEVVHLVVRDNNDIVYIDKVEADNTIRMASTVGKRSPFYSTSVGKAMLAYMPESEVKEIWENSDIIKHTIHTIVDFNEFMKELHDIKKKGYAIDDEENELGVRCIGAPVFNRKGEVEGSISISGPAIRVTKDKVEEFAVEVKKCAYMISKELGYTK